MSIVKNSIKNIKLKSKLTIALEAVSDESFLAYTVKATFSVVANSIHVAWKRLVLALIDVYNKVLLNSFPKKWQGLSKAKACRL